MTKTKQTARGGSSSRPDMATVRFGDEAEKQGHFKDIPEREWPDMDKPPQVAKEGEASKPTGVKGKRSKPTGK